MFGNPAQHGHMMSGVKAAIASPKTPPHLKAHLQKRVMTPTPLPRLTVPANPNNFPTETGTAAIPKPKKVVKKFPAIFGGPR